MAEYTSGALRSFAATELLSRSLLNKQIAVQLTQDEARAVRQCGYTFLAVSGEPLNIEEMKTALKTPYLSNNPDWNKADSKPVILAVYERLSDDELWTKVVSFNEESAIATQVVGLRLRGEKRKLLRGLVEGGLELLAAKVKSHRPVENTPRLIRPYGPWGPSDPVDAAKEEVEGAALDLLASNPEPEDRPIFLNRLSKETSKFDEILASLRGLTVVGSSDDRSVLAPHLQSNSESIELAASSTFLALSPNSVAAANELLSVPSRAKVQSVVSYALKATDKAVWPVLEPLLKNEDEEIRRIVCYFATQTQSRKQLTRLLERYLNDGRYFYNVVVLIDRQLYAPRQLAALFARDEEIWLRKLGEPLLTF